MSLLTRLIWTSVLVCNEAGFLQNQETGDLQSWDMVSNTNLAEAVRDFERQLVSQVQSQVAVEQVIHENQSAPSFYITMAIGWSVAIAILILQTLVFQLIQYILTGPSRKTGKYKSNDEVNILPVKPVGQMIAESSQRRSSPSFDKLEIMQLINGCPDRLEILTSLASHADAQSLAMELTERSCKANKLKLSDDSKDQIVSGIVHLVEAFRSYNDRVPAESSPLTPRERLRSAFMEVRASVRIMRALRLPPLSESRRTDPADAQQNDETISEEKYENGAPRFSKYDHHKSFSNSGMIQTYLSSFYFVDHVGALFIFIYSQLCGCAYVIYLVLKFPKMYGFLGLSLLFSRGQAMALIVQSVIQVALLTRGFMTWVRDEVEGSWLLQNIVDKHVYMHRWIGLMLVFSSFVHILAHVNGTIPSIINEQDVSKINEAFTYGSQISHKFNTWAEAFNQMPTVSGIILVVILIAFKALAKKPVRKRSFELFQYSHFFLIVAWAVCLCVHGSSQWLGVGVPLATISVVPMVIIYFLDKVLGIRSKNVQIVSAIVKKNSVLLEIDIEGSRIYYQSGMYIMVKVPGVSNFQWHPFTICSAGGSPVLRILFAVVGDWTTKFRDLLQQSQKLGTPFPKISLRGGFGAPAMSMTNSEHIIMVGAGVGATPFLSFLATICFYGQNGTGCKYDKIKSAVFYFVSREPEDFAWVNQYNAIIQSTPSLKDRIAVRLCLSKSIDTTATKDCTSAEVALFWSGCQVALNQVSSSTLQQELGAPTQFGRPNWKEELQSRAKYLQMMGAQDQGERMQIDVYLCGGKALQHALGKACDELETDRLEFRLFAEQFG